MNNKIIIMKALPNNELPPTHFIEVSSWKKGHTNNGGLYRIELIYEFTSITSSNGGSTIAVFKIRSK